MQRYQTENQSLQILNQIIKVLQPFGIIALLNVQQTANLCACKGHVRFAYLDFQLLLPVCRLRPRFRIHLDNPALFNYASRLIQNTR